MRVQPATARYSVLQTSDTLRIEIPSRDPTWVPLLALLWIGMIVALSARVLFAPSAQRSFGSLVFPLAVWTWMIVLCVGWLLWTLCGRETITIRGNELEHRRSLGVLGIGSRYVFAETNSFRVSNRIVARNGMRHLRGLPFLRAHGAIEFEYRGSTRRMGAGLDETEARHVFALLKPLVDARPRRERNHA